MNGYAYQSDLTMVLVQSEVLFKGRGNREYINFQYFVTTNHAKGSQIQQTLNISNLNGSQKKIKSGSWRNGK